MYKSVEAGAQLEFNRYLRAGTVGRNYSAILVKLLRLRQACCHPHLIHDFGIAVAAGVTPADLVALAKQLDQDVVARIRATEGNFECPVCYDGVPNPAIFLPCGHATCRECFAKIADPANAIRDGNENATGAKCPTCRGAVDPKRITDFESFKRVHMPELLTMEDKEKWAELEKEAASNDEDDEEESETESDDGDDVDGQGNLRGFIVDDDAEEDEDGDDEEEGLPGSSKKSSSIKAKGSKKQKKPKKSKGGKGKQREKKKVPKNVTLAELKKLASRSAKARRAYMRRLSEDYVSSAKIDQTMEILREVMNVPFFHLPISLTPYFCECVQCQTVQSVSQEGLVSLFLVRPTLPLCHANYLQQTVAKHT